MRKYSSTLLIHQPKSDTGMSTVIPDPIAHLKLYDVPSPSVVEPPQDSGSQYDRL